MELLNRLGCKPFLLSLVFILLSSTWTQAEDGWPGLSITGFVQGRFTGFMTDPKKPNAPLCENPSNDYAPESETIGLLKRLEFTLTDHLNENWRIVAGASISGPTAKFKEGYLWFSPKPQLQLRAGYLRVPFGIDPQTGADKMDTVEKPLIYGFGNFGWVGNLGFGMVGERDYGARVDYHWQEEFASFSPTASAGIFMGNGLGVVSRGVSQAMARISVASHIDVVEIRQDLSLGVSSSWGWNRLAENRTGRYLPIGTPGDLSSRPDAALTPAGLNDRGRVMVLGCDAASTMNDLTLKAEWVQREIHQGYWTKGFYATAIYNLDSWGAKNWEWVGRWEEVAVNYPDGIHAPGQRYQAATTGLTWKLGKFWQLQSNYIALLTNGIPHGFHGADLVITQVQFAF